MEGRCTFTATSRPPSSGTRRARCTWAAVAAPSGSSSHSLNTLDRSSRPPPADDPDSPLLDPDPALPSATSSLLSLPLPLLLLLLLLPVAPQSSCATIRLTSLASMGSVESVRKARRSVYCGGNKSDRVAMICPVFA